MKHKKTIIMAFVAATLALVYCVYGATLGNGVYKSVEQSAVNAPKMVALTFDDGPGPYTEQLLDILEQNQAKATFFVLGKKVKKYSDVLLRMKADGHIIGNHTYHHSRLLRQSEDEVKAELRDTDDALEEAIGVKTDYFRPTYGHYTNRMAGYVGKITVTWSYDTIDWKAKDTEKVYNRLMRNVKDGGIILMHDIHKTTVEAVERALPELAKQGYEFVTVETLLNRGAEPIEQGKAYRSCRHGKKQSYFVLPWVVNL